MIQGVKNGAFAAKHKLCSGVKSLSRLNVNQDVSGAALKVLHPDFRQKSILSFYDFFTVGVFTRNDTGRDFQTVHAPCFLMALRNVMPKDGAQ